MILEDRLYSAIALNKVLNVSRMRANGMGTMIKHYPSGIRLSKNIMIENFEIMSDNYDSYKRAIDMLGKNINT